MQGAREAHGRETHGRAPTIPGAGTPVVTVIVCTYNRADRVGRTVQAVLAQEGPDFELVVVDDGSPDATPEVLAALGEADPQARLRVVRQANAGLGAARNAGLATARGEWVVFLDDDDVPDPGWLAALMAPTGDPTVGISCVGAIAVDPTGAEICPLPVIPLDQPFGGVVASYRAGTFAVRAELCRAAGGYLDGLGTSHQFELFLRLQDEARRRGLRIAATDVTPLRIEWRNFGERSGSDPYVIYDATTWVMTRHPGRFAGQHRAVAAFEGIRGAAAARMGDWRLARRHFRAQVRLAPGSRRAWLRLGLAYVPPLGRRTWNRHEAPALDGAAGADAAAGAGAAGRAHRTNGARRSKSARRRSTVGVVVQRADLPGAPTPKRELFLANGYRENPPAPGGPRPLGRDRGVDRLARRLARRTPGLLVALDLGLEVVDDPIVALRDLAERAGDRPVLLAIADREATDPDRPAGPPSNPGHRREWSEDQLRLLLRSVGFDVQRTWRKADRVAVLARPFDEPHRRTL
ncbi:MAG TPA: glycosyltransferase family A protein [Acidimicrobiales bacterium]